jgi:transposase
VAQLGKLEAEQVEREWSEVEALLEGRKEEGQLELIDAHKPGLAQWRKVDVSRVKVERLREFGRVYMGLALWRRLGLHKLLRGLMPEGREEVGWDQVACILTLGRFSAQKSELSVAQRWYNDTALEDLLGVPFEKVNEARLYRGLDEILGSKDALCAHMMEQYRDWFGVNFEFLLYDVTSTFFEGEALKNTKAKRGYSRDSRPDCKQVCIGLVCTPEGLPVAYEVFPGNRSDVTTVQEIVSMMESKYGQAGRVWVMDRGMVSEDNLEWLRSRGAMYLVGTPRSRLRSYERELLDQSSWHEIREGLEVKLVGENGSQERFVLCRSTDRAAKEQAMLDRQLTGLSGELEKVHTALEKHPGSDPLGIERKIGKWLGKYPAAAGVTEVKLVFDGQGRAAGLKIEDKTERLKWARCVHGAYLLRTNHTAGDAQDLWKWYVQLSQAEAAFHTSKSDLSLRPVFHQKTHRVEAHILVSFLSLALWRTLEQWMASKGLGTCARELLHELDELRSMDVVLACDDGTKLRMRTVATPEKPLADLLAHLGLELPNRPRLVQNVVPNNDPNNGDPQS